MMKNRHLSKTVQQQGFYEFRRQMEYKSKWNNIQVIIADRFFPSSKLCSCCGKIKKDLKLSERIYKCECGNVVDRDLQAALDVYKRQPLCRRMYSLQFFPDTEFGDVAVLLHGLESDIVPSRTDCGNGSRSGPDAVVQHGVPLGGVGAYQVLDQCHRLLGRMIEDVYKRQVLHLHIRLRCHIETLHNVLHCRNCTAAIRHSDK